MKKKLFIVLLFLWVLLVWCSNQNKQLKQIDPERRLSENWISIGKTFNKKMDHWQYIRDLESFISYNVLSITENKPFFSDLFFSVKFDEESSLQWWVEIFQKKLSESRNYEFSDIDFNVKIEQQEKSTEPFDFSWNLSILHKDGEMYAKLHDLSVFMWEWNMVAKMYTLLWDLWKDNWINLEVHSWWIILVDEDWDRELPHLIWVLKNVLGVEDVQPSANSLWSFSELVAVMSSYVDLWISTDELTMLNYQVSYFELSDKTIQKEFTWSFQWKESAFDLSFIASEKWLNIHLYNIKEYNEDTSDYEDFEREFVLSLRENKKSEYFITFESSDLQQEVLDLEGEIKYGDTVEFSAYFALESLELMAWQRVSWRLNWNVIKKPWMWGKKIPELTGDVFLWSDLRKSL